MSVPGSVPPPRHGASARRGGGCPGVHPGTPADPPAETASAEGLYEAVRRELRDAVGAAVDAGATKADVARFLGVTRTTLYAYLNRPGPG